ncbi:hypothetical protein OS493_009462 [Desmophyllum pertusum]|uniref:Uncharacterized protein n=1 Tax=Desmophyllum pertusum TaxID=174260 RepID=A0A9W9Z375_9CNID|nr:hypothetical protein OS493_009462 [Desmophyllum pertusum]
MEQANSKCKTDELTAPHSHIPYGEAGSGFYGSKVLDTMPCIEALAPIALECVRSYPVTPGSVFTIADYGCADGGSSMSLIYSCVEELRKLHGNELEILIFYEDQPVNDFTSLFSFLQGLIPGPQTYLTKFPNVYAAACGTQFFAQCFPCGSIQLGLCCIAVHWLSKMPCSITGALYHHQAQRADERELFSRQAAADWEMFLLMRAKELCTGGSLALIVFAEGDDGQLPGNTTSTKVPFYQVLYEVWRNMAEDGVITMDEVNKTTMAVYIRTRKELQLPFTSEKSPVRKAGLSLVSLEIKTFPCPHTKMRQETGDVKMAAKSMAEETRAWSNSTFLSGLSDERTLKEKNYDCGRILPPFGGRVCEITR